MLAVGTENQTKLVGAPVKGALFNFAPAIDQHLKAHLFGDIFARANLDWKNRELANSCRAFHHAGRRGAIALPSANQHGCGPEAIAVAQLPQVFEMQGEQEAARQLQSALQVTLR